MLKRINENLKNKNYEIEVVVLPHTSTFFLTH